MVSVYCCNEVILRRLFCYIKKDLYFANNNAENGRRCEKLWE